MNVKLFTLPFLTCSLLACGNRVDDAAHVVQKQESELSSTLVMLINEKEILKVSDSDVKILNSLKNACTIGREIKTKAIVVSKLLEISYSVDGSGKSQSVSPKASFELNTSIDLTYLSQISAADIERAAALAKEVDDLKRNISNQYVSFKNLTIKRAIKNESTTSKGEYFFNGNAISCVEHVDTIDPIVIDVLEII